MSDNTSHATQPSESDFLDSQPLDSDMKAKSTPSVGDLSSIETTMETPDSEIHSVGNLSNIEDSTKSEILGDISLLDEAFAEMNESEVQDAQETSAQNDTSIPTLKDSIDTPSESRILPADAQSASIPLLDQEATVFAEMLKPLAESVAYAPPSTPISEPMSALASQVSDIASEDPAGDVDDEPLFDSPEAENNTNISEMNSALEMAAELISEAVPPEAQEAMENSRAATEKAETVVSTFEASNAVDESEAVVEQASTSFESGDAALEALLDEEEIEVPEHNDPNVESDISDLQLDIGSEVATDATSIDEKISIATAESKTDENDSEIEINEMPISAMVDDMSEPSEFPASFAEALNSAPVDTDSGGSEMLTELEGTEISAFNPDIDLNSELSGEAITEISHSVGIAGQGQEEKQDQNNLNLSIPFELHSQLSHKIDELVVQATSSITEELHSQLSSQLDNLLSNAVESVLPKLVNQMANELRTDVNGRIKQQLPNIINDVLNKTRLNK